MGCGFPFSMEITFWVWPFLSPSWVPGCRDTGRAVNTERPRDGILGVKRTLWRTAQEMGRGLGSKLLEEGELGTKGLL